MVMVMKYTDLNKELSIGGFSNTKRTKSKPMEIRIWNMRTNVL